MNPQELCTAYLAEICRLYGDDYANESELWHSRGWYYLKLARRASDGSYFVSGVAECYRRKEIEKRLENLRQREPIKEK